MFKTIRQTKKKLQQTKRGPVKTLVRRYNKKTKHTATRYCEPEPVLAKLATMFAKLAFCCCVGTGAGRGAAAPLGSDTGAAVGATATLTGPEYS
jgi:hypothetical protein